MRASLQRALMLVLIVGLVIVVLNFVPAIAEERRILDGRLPLWLAGLAAPIVYVVKKLFGWLGGAGGNRTEQDVRAEQERLKAELARLRAEVADLDARRAAELAALNTRLAEQDQVRRQREADVEAARRRLRESESRLRTGGIIPETDYD